MARVDCNNEPPAPRSLQDALRDTAGHALTTAAILLKGFPALHLHTPPPGVDWHDDCEHAARTSVADIVPIYKKDYFRR
jgi:hypothetical protein